jgi:hypothetical protein
MPSHGHASVPKLNASCPRKLPRYLAKLALLFQQHNVVPNMQKKTFACHYVNIESAKLWELWPEYAATST